MKKLILTIAILAAGLGFSPAAQAGPILGSDFFAGSPPYTATGGTIDVASTITATYQTNSGGSGDFVGSPLTSFGPLTIDFTASGAGIFGFSSATYGDFVSSGFNINVGVNGAIKFRIVQIAGAFYPHFGTQDPSAALFDVTFRQNAAGVITIVPGDRGLMTTDGVAAPEPATLVMLGTFLVPVGFGLIRRRRSLAK
ncbi:MAG: PEP-CTERM sorting domain-containing protein [Planctomycetaceae bacterium]|nr:PEP-CTERM sorting domain-containing protein [Planctomycetaceae bacterium]